MTALDAELTEALLTVLGQSQRLGFLGPRPVDTHLEHAMGYSAVAGAPKRVLDLGSGGGLPGLVLAAVWREAEFVLLDSMAKRCAFLRWATERLAYGDRVRVAHGRAETLGRSSDLRGRFDLVTARSFGQPATTAECAAPFLVSGGHLIVSEPPEPLQRWPDEGLAKLGLALVSKAGDAFAIMEQRSLVTSVYPRRSGLPAKRPLF